MPKTEEGLYDVLEKVLRASKQPIDAAELWDMDSVREEAPSLNRISDYLGNMWRKGLLTRTPSPGGKESRTRWAYLWKGKIPEKPDPAKAVDNVLLDRAQMKILDEGSKVVIELPKLIITIQHR